MNPDDILADLDDQQRAAAEAILGPVCILAGAGTGKTRTITHRIAYGIARGYFAPNRVLALTYTNRAAGELRARLRGLGAGAVSAKTFHSAALHQLQYFWPQLAGTPAPRVLDSKSKFIFEAAQKLGMRLDANAVREMAAEIEWRKYNLLSIEQYGSHLPGGNKTENEAARPAVSGISPGRNLEIHELYEQAKVNAQVLDWEDVLILNLGLLEAEPTVVAQVRQQYRFFTVDEYQDVSPLQQKLLDAWLGEHSDVCVVGDPNQTIYSFTGATNEFLHSFAGRYPDAQVFELNTNYRSSPEVIRVANRLAVSSKIAPLVSFQPSGPAVKTVGYSNAQTEAAEVAGQIKALISRKVPPQQIAVLYRVNGQSEAFEKALTDLSIEYQVRGGERFFSRTEIQQAIRAIRAESASPSQKSTYQAVSEICQSLGWSKREPDTGGLQREKWEALNSLVQLVEELPAETSLSDLVLELEERQRTQHEPQRQAVTLATMHSAKGLEWEAVFIVGASEGYLPISYAKTERELAEEQRLAYVAVTRARRELCISWHQGDHQQSRQPSRYLEQLRTGDAGLAS